MSDAASDGPTHGGVGKAGQESGKGKGKGKGKALCSAPAPSKGQGKARAKRAEELHAACQFDDEAELRKMLAERGAAELLAARASRGATLLHTAAVNGSIRTARLLLAEGAPADAANNWKEVPLHLAAASGHAAVVEALIAARAHLDAPDNWGRTALRIASESGGATAVEEALRAAGAVDSGGGAGVSGAPEPTQGQQEQQRCIAEEFMARVQERGPDTLVPEPQVRQMFAPSSGAAGAPAAGSAPAAAGPPSGAPRKGLSKLVEYPGDPQAVARHLEDPGVDPGGKDMFSLTALHKFAAWNKVDLLELLLPHLSEEHLNATGGDDGYSAPHHAVSMGSVNTLARLLEDPRVSRTVVDKSGRTALELAAAMPGFEALVELLS